MNGIVFGRYLYEEEGYTYIFGNRDEQLARRPYLARISNEYPPDDFSRWEFFTGRGWAADVSQSRSIIPAGQGSVSFCYSLIRLADRYYLISQSDFLGPQIYRWEAGAITGPYTNRSALYDTLYPLRRLRLVYLQRDGSSLFYDGKGHYRVILFIRLKMISHRVTRSRHGGAPRECRKIRALWCSVSAPCSSV